MDLKSNWNGNFLVVDDFLKEKDKNYTLDFISNFDYSEFQNKLGLFPIQVCLDPRIPENIRNYFQKISESYMPTLMKYLEELAPKKCHLYDYCKFKIIISPPGFKEKNHIDNFSKLLSAIVYLSPENNYGTFFHESIDDEKPKEITWKVNRCLITVNKYNKTWHSYRSHVDQYRYVVLITLHTRKIYSHMFVDLKFLDFLLFSAKRLIKYDLNNKIRETLGKIKKFLFNIPKVING